MSDTRSSAPAGTRTTAPDGHEAIHPRPVGPPSKHQLAVMIWTAVFPTLAALNLAFGPWLAALGTVLRTLVLATIAVPIVIYGLMPPLHHVRVRILTQRAA